MGHVIALHGADVLNLWRPNELEHDSTYLTANVGTGASTVDPYETGGAQRIQVLLGGADVFYANRRPGYLARIGLSPEQAARARVADQGRAVDPELGRVRPRVREGDRGDGGVARLPRTGDVHRRDPAGRLPGCHRPGPDVGHPRPLPRRPRPAPLFPACLALTAPLSEKASGTDVMSSSLVPRAGCLTGTVTRSVLVKGTFARLSREKVPCSRHPRFAVCPDGSLHGV
ncbi:CoA transferase [Amycolatopsis sp. H20-H5]|uniref:CoA transferase n=1 Tax=Amycolatopsis sp. H20-H5 TaxID=3046309 RepID=UPI002DB9E3F2|nr:CoA transferase [Amycolatopsis sp. H20-H5]MEC3979682.1 CoA transferase [Amycolatopsis sp. H20-H5]